MRYNTFKYGTGVLYGATPQTTLYWAIQIDWYDNNYTYGINEAERCINLDWERGRDTFLESNTKGIRFPSVGRATISLDNFDGKYNPININSPYYGLIKPGHNARIGLTTPDSAGAIIWRFTGRVSDISPNGWRNGYVNIVIEDALQWLYDQDVSIDVQTQIRIDQAIQAVLTEAAWPWASQLAISSDTMPYWWASKQASTEIADLTASGIGYFSVLGDGTARFLRKSDVSSSGVDLSDDNTLNNPDVAQFWENYKNIIKVKWYPRQLQTSGIVWSDISCPVFVAAGATYTTFGDYTFNNENIPVLYAAISASDITANTAADGSGTNLSASFSATLTDFGTSAKIVIKNNSASNGYLTLSQVIGQAISVPYAGSYIDDRNDYATNPRTWTLELPWQQISARAESIAQTVADYLSESRYWPTISVENHFDVQFTPDIFDTLRYASAYLAIDESFRVGKIREKWISSNGQAVLTTFVLEPYVPGGIAWTWPILDFGTDTVFG